MGESDKADYLIYLQRPLIKRLRRAKHAWDIILILACALIPLLLRWINLSESEENSFLFGEVLLATGMIPFLLALPLTLAEWGVGMRNRCAMSQLCNFFCFSSLNHFIGYLFYIVCMFTGVALFLSREKGKTEIKGALTEIMTEVALIYGVTKLLGIPTVDEDETRSFLTHSESLQMERSGCLDAAFAEPTDVALNGEYHEDLVYHYPNAVRESYEDIEGAIVDGSGEDDGELAHSGGELCAQRLSECAPGWESPWFVAALGRCSVDVLGRQVLDGLLTSLSGASPFNSRFVTQCAIITFGNLYFRTGDSAISQRLINVWMYHEISHVRDSCALSVMAIGCAPHVAFMKRMMGVEHIDGTIIAEVEPYFQQHGLSLEPLKARSLQEAVKHVIGTPDNVQLMALVAACSFLVGGSSRTARDQQLKTDLDVLLQVSQVVLRSPFHCHLVKTLLLEALARGTLRVAASSWASSWRLQIICLGESLFRSSVFKSVRQAAERLLKACGYQFGMLAMCFGVAAVETFQAEGWRQGAQTILRRHIPPELFSAIVERLEGMDSVEGDLTEMFDTPVLDETPNPLKDPVMLLYVYMAEFENSRVEDYFIQARLNSKDRFERFVGLVCIGILLPERGARMLKQKVVPGLVQTELISDVRELAIDIIEGPADAEQQDCSPCCGGVRGDDEETDRQARLVRLETARLEGRVARGL